MKLFNEILNDESGATAIEYGLIAALIAVALIAALVRWAARSTTPSRGSTPSSRPRTAAPSAKFNGSSVTERRGGRKLPPLCLWFASQRDVSRRPASPSAPAAAPNPVAANSAPGNAPACRCHRPFGSPAPAAYRPTYTVTTSISPRLHRRRLAGRDPPHRLIHRVEHARLARLGDRHEVECLRVRELIGEHRHVYRFRCPYSPAPCHRRRECRSPSCAGSARTGSAPAPHPSASRTRLPM